MPFVRFALRLTRHTETQLQLFGTSHLGDLIKRGLFSRIREGLYRFTDPAMRVYIRLRLRKEEPTLMGEAALQLALPY